MAVLGRLLLGSGERLDSVDILSIDSYVAADFKYLIQSFIGANKPYILYGLDVISPQDAIGTENISIRIAESVVYYPGSQAGAFYYGLEQGNINALPLIPELRKNATNFVYLTFGSFDTAKDSRAFWDPDQSGGAGGEFSQDVNTETALKIEVNVSVSTFPENTIPICKVVVGASVIASIQDCRDHFFRLGTGGVSPDPFSSYSFRQDPSAPYARLEPPTTMTSALNPNPFQGGDKNIRTLKEWMDVVMTRIKELGGTTYWYQGSGVPGAGPNVSNVFLDALGSTIKSKGEWQHSGTTPGEATWTEDIHYYSLIDSRDLILRANTITLPSSDKVAWIDLKREAPFNGVAASVDWLNGATYIQGASGSFINLSKGDWVKKSSDPNSYFRRVQELSTDALGLAPVTAALALYAVLSDPYPGVTGTDIGHYTQGEYVLADINITDRNDAAIAAAGGNFFWLAYRSDTTLGLALASSVTLSLNITDADGITAKCTHAAHGLVDKDRITIVGGAYAGTYIIEYENADVFYINTTVLGGGAATAYYGLVTTDALSTDYGYSLETANHGFKSGETIIISGTPDWDGQYVVNYRNATQVQIPIGSPLVNNGGVDGEIVSLPRLNVRTEFGTVKVVAGQSTNIGDADSENLISFIGMDSLAQTYPNYSIPGGYNALDGHQNYNSLTTDSLTTRVSRLSAMMADRVQDRGMQIIGRTNIRNVTNGVNQEVSALTNLTLKKPGSADLTITMTSNIIIPANSIAVIDIDRDGSGSIVPTVESWGSNYVISENKIILFYRFGDTTVHTWRGEAIAASGHLNTQYTEDSQNRNVYAFNPGQVKLNASTGLLKLALDEAAEVSRIVVKTAAATPQSSYFVAYSANDAEKYVIWYDKDAAGTQPVVAGTTVYIQVPITTGQLEAAVAAATITAVNGAAGVETTASLFSTHTVVLTNDVVGFTTDTADGTTATTYFFETTQAGFDPDIELVIPGAANKNIVDVDAINALNTLILADGQSAWVRINRFALKTFNTIQISDLPDTDGAGSIYITDTISVPIDQDVFVLWTRIKDNIAETNKSQRPDGNVYEETYDITAAPASNSYEIQGPVAAGAEIVLPPDTRDTISGVQEYIVGSGQLEVFLNGQYLVVGNNWTEVGTPGSLSKRFTLTQDLVPGDELTLRIDAHGAVYFASDAGGGGDLQDAYDAGRFININSGQPIVITGTPGQKLVSIQGDMEVTGVIDPAGITFSQEASDPLGVSDYGFWRNNSNQLLFKRGANPAFNFDIDFVRRDGSLDMQANLDMGGNQVVDVGAPSAATDAATKGYADTTFMKLDGSNPMAANLDMATFKVVNLGAPTLAADAATKGYADSTFLKLDGSNPMAANLDFGTFKGINVVDPTGPQDAATKAYVDGLLDGRSWKQSVRVASTADIDLGVAADPSPVDGITLANGDRILLKNQAAPAENGIYVAVDADDPTTWVRASDANTGLELEGAAVFVQEGTASSDFQFAQTADSITLGTTALVWVITSANSFSGHDMISLSGGQISVDLASDAGLESSNPGNAAGQLRVKLDGSTLTRSSSGTKVADGGITGTQINASVAGDGLDGGGGSALSVDVSEISGTGLEDDGSNNLRIAAAAAGDGLQGGGGSALAVDVSDFAGTGLEDDGSENLRIAASAAGAGLTGGGGSALSVIYAPSVQATGEIAGQPYSAATLYAVRYGQDAETAGRIYGADNDASSADNFHAIGLVLTVGALSAADAMPNIHKMGLITVTGHGFTVGKPVFLGASGALTSTAPTAAGSAVVKVGMIKSTNVIDVQIQIMGVN